MGQLVPAGSREVFISYYKVEYFVISNLMLFIIYKYKVTYNANADDVVGGEPASHHVDPASIPGSGVVICDLVAAL
jgi:hypothetical protein